MPPPERRAAMVRAATWTSLALPAWLLAAWLLALLPLAAVTWGLVLGCELGLAWIQGAGYPPLGIWSWLSETRSTTLAGHLSAAVTWLRSRVPWDGVGCAAVLAGPLAIVVIVTTADWAPRLATILMVGAAAGEIAGTVSRARRWRSTSRNENGDQ
jgi:hypothetical protein